MTSHRTLRVTPADRERSPYLLVPFDVPVGTRRIEVDYGHEEGGTIDLGLVDPRGAGFPGFAGFRGWSGSARREFAITPDAATPGYLPGPIQPGTWQVVLGLYRVPPEGLTVEVRVRCSPDAGTAPHHRPAAAPTAPMDGGRAWYPGDLHSHTHHSDAPGDPDALVAAARRHGLRFLAVTDHNTTSHLPHLAASPPDLLLVPGQEVTTYLGHLNVWGLDRLVDFRCRDEGDMRTVLEDVRARGWVSAAAHPHMTHMAWTYGYGLPVDCIEVWHGPSVERNQATLADWDALLRDGRRVIAVGGSDYHCMRAMDWLAMPTTWVLAEHLTVPAVLAAIRAGRVVIGERGGARPRLAVERDGVRWEVGDTVPAGGPVRVRCDPGARLLTALGEVPAEEPLDLGRHRHVRAELRRPDDGWNLAGLTNPIWGATPGETEAGGRT